MTQKTIENRIMDILIQIENAESNEILAKLDKELYELNDLLDIMEREKAE